jgi:hypothetical protein
VGVHGQTMLSITMAINAATINSNPRGLTRYSRQAPPQYELTNPDSLLATPTSDGRHSDADQQQQRTAFLDTHATRNNQLPALVQVPGQSRVARGSAATTGTSPTNQSATAQDEAASGGRAVLVVAGEPRASTASRGSFGTTLGMGADGVIRLTDAPNSRPPKEYGSQLVSGRIFFRFFAAHSK